MERPLIISAVAYLSGLLLGAAASYFPCLILLLVTVGVGGSVYRLRKWRLSSKGLLFGWAFLLLGMGNLQMTWPSHPADDLSRMATRDPVMVRGQIDAPFQHRPGRLNEVDSTILIISTEAVVIGGKEQKVSGRLRLTVHGFSPEVGYGDWIEVKTRLRPLTSFRNPGGFDYVRYVERKGIRARATVYRPADLRWIQAGGNPILRVIYRWREEIRSAMVRSLSPDAAAILQAMIIGESGFLTPEIREVFMASGITHILSISGSHLSLVALVFFATSLWLIRYLPPGLLLKMGRALHPRQVGVLVTIPPVVFYALLAGGQIATIRSLIMILVYLGAVWLMRSHDALNALALAVLLVTVWDPQAIFDISFQLSYGAVLAMILAIQKRGQTERPSTEESPRFGSVWSKIKTAFLLTAVAGLSTAPLVAFHFNKFNWVGLLSNLIVTPLVGMLVVPLGLISAIAVIITGSSTFPLAGLHNGIITLLMAVVRFFAGFPWAELHVPSPPIPVIAFWYSAAWFAFLARTGYGKRAGMAVLCLGLTLPWTLGMGKMAQDHLLRVTFLDVGQGDAAFIEFPTGQTLLIDGGVRYGSFDAGRLSLAPYLWDHSIHRIDYVVMTHPQVDHAGGLVFILRKFQVGEIWTNGATKQAVFFEDFIRVAHQRKIAVKTINAESPPLTLGESIVQILHPSIRSTDLQDNDRSLVIRIQHGRKSFLFTGDIEAPAEQELLRWGDYLESSVLKVPHHGSRSSIEPEFLIGVCPQIAVISSGTANPYGHPAPETLAAYQLLGSRVYRTDRDGAVIMSTDGDRLHLSTYRDHVLTPAPWGRGMLDPEGGNWKKLIRRWIGADPA